MDNSIEALKQQEGDITLNLTKSIDNDNIIDCEFIDNGKGVKKD